ncbi:Mu-like prophage major head subunit gpT family protein [Pasteurella multocida]
MATFKKSEVLKAIESQFKKDFVTGLSLIKPQWSEIAMKVSSNTKVNTYGILSEFPKMREWVGKRQRNAMQAVGMSIENKLFESTVGIPRVDIEDDQVGLFRPIIQQAGQSAAELPDDLVFALLKKGKTTLCYDGQNFFDTDHPVYDNVDGTGSNTTQSNITTGSSRESATFYLFDTTNAIRPLIWQERTAPEITPRFDPEKSESVWNEDVYEWGVRARGAAGFGFWQLAHCVEQTELTAENIMAAVSKMQALKGDGGKLLNIRPNVILVPPALEFKARQICEAEVINGTTNVLKGRLKVMVSSQIL